MITLYIPKIAALLLLVFVVCFVYYKKYKLKQRLIEKEQKDKEQKNRYNFFVDMINDTDDVDKLHELQFADHGDDQYIWEYGYEWEDALWLVCNERRRALIYDNKFVNKLSETARKKHNKMFLIEV